MHWERQGVSERNRVWNFILCFVPAQLKQLSSDQTGTAN